MTDDANSETTVASVEVGRSEGFHDWMRRQVGAAHLKYVEASSERTKKPLWRDFMVLTGILAEYERRVPPSSAVEAGRSAREP